MHYEKPLVIDLNGSARGANPLLCKSGVAATGGDNSCAAGTGAGWTCSGGIGPTGANSICAGGASPGVMNDCSSGTGVSIAYCESGSGGANDPNGCAVGPSFA